MTAHPLTLLLSGLGLPEGARWYGGELVFSDMTLGGVFRWPEGAAEPVAVIPHRKGVGGLVAHRHGGLVVSGRNVTWKGGNGPDAGEVYLETGPDEQFFNDLTADSDGRLFVGSVATQPDGVRTPVNAGRLYRVEIDGAACVLADDVLTSNGLGTDPTGRFLYHVDSYRHTVWRFDQRAHGQARECFADTREYAGVPDGLAVATDGSVWVALAGGSVVVAWDAGGRRVAEIAVPHALATSVCFGGPDLTDLYILAGVDHEHPAAGGGAVYRCRGQLRGLPSPVAAVRRRHAGSRS